MIGHSLVCMGGYQATALCIWGIRGTKAAYAEPKPHEEEDAVADVFHAIDLPRPHYAA